MDDDLINKAAITEYCVVRAIEEYQVDPGSFAAKYPRKINLTKKGI